MWHCSTSGTASTARLKAVSAASRVSDSRTSTKGHMRLAHADRVQDRAVAAITPASSSRFIRAWVGDFDSPIRRARSTALIRPSVCRTRRIARSKRSSARGHLAWKFPSFHRSACIAAYVRENSLSFWVYAGRK
jgi:hypothetical protein